MKRSLIPAVLIFFAAVLQTCGSILINDTWLDGLRNDPSAASGYAENDGVSGTDADADGDIESAWFKGGAGTLSPVAPGGPLRGSGFAGSSASWTSYFTPEGSEVALNNPGDQLKITWSFTLSGVNANNTSQGFRLAVVDSPAAARLSSDTSPGSAAYTGYGMFMNMGQTLGGSNPFQLKKRDGSSNALLSSSGSPPWIILTNGATGGTHGYDDGTTYTFVLSLTRNTINGLDVSATMIGGTLNATGLATLSFTDTVPNGFKFDTFALRPSDTNSTAAVFNSSLFKVEFVPSATPPSITIDPQDQAAFVSQSATFNVLAAGTAPLSYQWLFNTNTVLDAQTNSDLTLTNLQVSDAGMYSVVVTNSYGSVTSEVAQLTVNLPTAPSIVTQPQSQTVLPGQSAIFTVAAGGSQPLSYRWYFNTNTPLPNATDETLIVTNVGPDEVGTYSVIISNFVSSIASTNAVLSLNTDPVAPVFSVQPASQVVGVGGIASFTPTVTGTAPIEFQWRKNGVPISGATSASLTLTNVQSTNNGSYTLSATNSVGVVVSDPATLTVSLSAPISNTAYNLTGFGQATTGGGVIPETDPAYRKVYSALDLANAILSANKTAGSVKVIEIMNDLDLGWNEVGSAVQTLGSTPFRAHAAPKLHPRLLVTGVSLIDIKSKSGLTIFSANGSTIRHACFNIKSTANIIVRNLKFDELWEWDESSKGNYDGNDWDFIDLGNGGTVSNIWIDHCTFTKAYDGIVDIKGGSFNITLSWCRYVGDDGATNPNSFVWQQINSLESNKLAYAMYNSLRTVSGFSTTDIVTIIQGHDKTHLVGANDGVNNANNAAQNAQHSITFHHQWFQNCWDRCVPRLRAGNVHDYNIFVDDTAALAAKRLRDQHFVSSSYSFNPFLNGSISTESGAILVEKSIYKDCLTPLRNNQTDPSNPAYTGKIKAVDTIYQFDSTIIRGNSTDPGNPLGPFQAPVIPFAWNLPGNELPYVYQADDPSQLQSMLAAGAGAGAVNWNKTNWLMTTYAATPPVILADPQSQITTPGQSVTFTTVAGGSQPLSYQWYFNTNTPLNNTTNAAITITNVQAANLGSYSVVVTNSAGSATSALATLSFEASWFAAWQTSHFNSEQLADPTISGPTAMPAGDGVANIIKYALGLEPFVVAHQPLVNFEVVNGDALLTYHRPASVDDAIYRVEVSTDLGGWTQTGVTQQLAGTDGDGLQIWQATYSGTVSPTRYFRLLLIY